MTEQNPLSLSQAHSRISGSAKRQIYQESFELLFVWVQNAFKYLFFANYVPVFLSHWPINLPS